MRSLKDSRQVLNMFICQPKKIIFSHNKLLIYYHILPETHKGLKRVTLICLLCPMLVIIQFRKYHIWNEKKITDQSNFVNNVMYRNFPSGSRARLKKWPTNGGKTPESRESFQRLKPGILPKH